MCKDKKVEKEPLETVTHEIICKMFVRIRNLEKYFLQIHNNISSPNMN